MTKKIETVVEDIERMLGGLSHGTDISADDSAINAFGATVANKVRDAFKARIRQPRPKDRIAPSELGESCLRKLWYSRQPEHVNPDEMMEPHTYVKFMYGDILEELVLLLVHHAGHEVSDKQKEVTFPINAKSKVRGYIDATVDGTLIDVKSSSNYGFKKFKDGFNRNEDPFGYLGQLDAYATAMKTGDKGFLAINKESGKIVWCPHTNTGMRIKDSASLESERIVTDNHVADIADAAIRAVNQPTAPEPPLLLNAVPHGKKNHKLCTKCSYCHHKIECYKDSNNGHGLRKFIYSNGPIWLTDVGEVPRVPEVPVPKKGKKDDE